MTTSQKPYGVCYWGSDPSLENDDCWVRYEVETLAEAEAFFNQPVPTQFTRSTQVIELDRPEVSRIRLNPDWEPNDDNDWRNETARLAGMEGGTTAYNDMMGY